MIRYFVLFLTTLAASAQLNISNPFYVAGVLKPAASGGGGPDVTENFEGTGYETAWTEATGNADEDYTTTVLEGSQSCYLAMEAAQIELRKSFTATDTVYAYFMFRFSTLPTGTRRQFKFADSSGNTLAEAYIVTGGSGEFQMDNGAVSTQAGATTVNTTYHCWMEYTKGTGANSVSKFTWSTTGTKPTSGNYINITTGTSTDQAARFEFGTWSSSASGNLIVDKFRLSYSTPFGDNPS